MVTRILTFISLALPVCVSCANSVWGQQRMPSEIALGFIIDMTGPATSLGEDCRQGIELAKHSSAGGDSVNRAPIQFIFGDSKGDPKTAVTEFTRMVNSEKVVAVLVSRTHLAMAVNPVSRQRQVPILASSANPNFTDDNKYAFRIWVRADQEGEALADRAIATGSKNIAFITTEDDYLMAMTASFKEHFSARGGMISFDETVDKDFVDFSSLVSQLKRRGPDTIFMNVTIPQLGIAYRRMHELGLKKKFFSSYWVFKKEVQESAGSQALEGVTAVEMDYQKPNFGKVFEVQFNRPPPSSMAYSCYVGTAQLLEAINKNREIRTPAEMYAELVAMDSIKLLDEPAVFKNRELQSPLLYEVYHGGRVEVLDH